MVTASMLPLPPGVTVTDGQAAAAMGIIEAYCNWSLESQAYTVTLDSDGGEFLFLPAMQVQSVASVTLNGTLPDGSAFPTLVVGSASGQGVDVTWGQSGALRWVRDGCGWPCGDQRVTVSFTAGYATMPQAVLAVAAAVAESVATTHVLQSQLDNVGGVSQNRTYSAATNAGAGLTAIECAVLDRYRIASVR